MVQLSPAAAQVGLARAFAGTELGLERLWLDYVGLGGNAGLYETEAYLAGLMPMSAYEHNMLAQAVNEWLNDPPPPVRAPYRDVGFQAVPRLLPGNGWRLTRNFDPDRWTRERRRRQTAEAAVDRPRWPVALADVPLWQFRPDRSVPGQPEATASSGVVAAARWIAKGPGAGYRVREK